MLENECNVCKLFPDEQKNHKIHTNEDCGCDLDRPMTEGEAEMAKGLDEYFEDLEKEPVKVIVNAQYVDSGQYSSVSHSLVNSIKFQLSRMFKKKPKC